MNEKRYKILQFIINFCLLPFALFLLLIICILIFATTSHASTATSPQFPIYVDNIDVTPYQTYINNTYGGFWNLTQNNVIGWGSQENGYFIQSFAVPQVPDEVQDYLSFSPSNLSSVYPDYDYNNNTITLTFNGLVNDNYQPWRIMHFYSNGVGPSYPYATTFNSASTLNKGVYGNTGATLNFVSSTIYLTGNNAWQVDKPIFVNELLPIVPDIGTAIIPPSPILPEYPSGDTSPTQVPPSYTPSDYQWTNPPNFDGSSVENALNSVKDTLVWLADNLHLEFKNITDNGKHFVEYIGKTIQYYGNAILETFNNFIQNFYDNMANLIQPIFDKINYLSEPLDLSEVSSAWTSSNTYCIYNDFHSFFTTFDTVFDNSSEPNNLIIPIHIENISLFYNFGCHSPILLDLSQYGDFRTPIRAFCWVFVSFGAVFLTENQLSMWLQGGSSSSGSPKGGG